MATSIERIIRDKNYLELELKMTIKKMAKMEAENSYLKEREKILTALENSLPQRIEKYKENNAPLPVIQELEYIKNMLEEEKIKLSQQEEDDE